MARKAVVTFKMAQDAFEGLKVALDGIGFEGKWIVEIVNEPVALGSAEKGFKGLRVVGDAPKGFPTEFANREDAYNTMTTWTNVLTLIRELSPENASQAVEMAAEVHEATDAADNGQDLLPEHEESEKKAPAPTQRRRRVSESAK